MHSNQDLLLTKQSYNSSSELCNTGPSESLSESVIEGSVTTVPNDEQLAEISRKTVAQAFWNCQLEEELRESVMLGSAVFHGADSREKWMENWTTMAVTPPVTFSYL